MKRNKSYPTFIRPLVVKHENINKLKLGLLIIAVAMIRGNVLFLVKRFFSIEFQSHSGNVVGGVIVDGGIVIAIVLVNYLVWSLEFRADVA